MPGPGGQRPGTGPDGDRRAGPRRPDRSAAPSGLTTLTPTLERTAWTLGRAAVFDLGLGPVRPGVAALGGIAVRDRRDGGDLDRLDAALVGPIVDADVPLGFPAG